MARIGTWSAGFALLGIAIAAVSLPDVLAADANPDAVIAGVLSIESPTLQNLGFDWAIEGDANHNAAVAVSYRRTGETSWRAGMPMLRLDGEQVVANAWFNGNIPQGDIGRTVDYTAPNMFAGSVFDLTPDTEYEIQFTLSDPDGVSGGAVRTVRVRTRPEPMPAKDGRVFHVYPPQYVGPRQQPAFSGLLAAYYYASIGGDWYNAAEPRVHAGDVILVHAGLYKDQRFRYGHEGRANYTLCCGTTYDGTYYLTAKGTPERPIVIKAAGDGEVIFDGDGNYNLFNVMAADYNYFEGLTVRNTLIAFEAGLKNIAGAKGLTFKHCSFTDIGVGIHTDYSGSGGFYIADNVFIGRHRPDQFWGWNGEWQKLPGYRENSDMLSQYAVKVYGPGNVVAYNRVLNFHDGIDNATYGNPDGWPGTPRDRQPSSIDIYNNFISNMHDNCIEADGAMQNIRVMRNVCFNSGSMGYSLQPILGGPAYFIRNIQFNALFTGAMKFSENPAGGVFYNNTFVGAFATTETGANMHLLNNLVLQDGERLPVLKMMTSTNYSTSDYNGFFTRRSHAAFEWDSPPFTKRADYASALEERQFDTLNAYSRATGQDAHSVEIDYSVFQNVRPVDPNAPVTTVYSPENYDLRLRRGTAAIDKGVVIPNVTDGFTGKAPDLGALEYGQPLPHYGPRDVTQ